MSQDKVRKVDALPILDQVEMGKFPDFDSDQHVLLAFGTAWGNMEMESAACAAITACKQAGEWKPLDVKDYFEVLQRYPSFKIMPQTFVNGVWMLVDAGDAEIVEYQERQYFVPTPKLVKTALAEGVKLRIS